MLRNLIAEMARHQVSEKVLAQFLDRDYRWVRKRLCETRLSSGELAQFGTLDLQRIKQEFFPHLTMDYLAESDIKPEQSAS
jgi:hypothetical protein